MRAAAEGNHWRGHAVRDGAGAGLREGDGGHDGSGEGGGVSDGFEAAEPLAGTACEAVRGERREAPAKLRAQGSGGAAEGEPVRARGADEAHAEGGGEASNIPWPRGQGHPAEDGG